MREGECALDKAVLMRAVRCEVCGAKAMIAAAQCPKCGHLFELRDGFGGLLPLAYCSACESYYPESLGECKWCGTKPEHPPIAPQLWRGVGAALLLVMVGTAWVFRHRPEADGSLIAAHMRATQDTAPRSTSLPVDTALASTVSAGDRVSSTPTVVPQAAPSTASTPVAVAPSTMLPSPSTAVTPATPVTPADHGNVSSVDAAPGTAGARRSARWVSSVSRDWVIVRASANSRSRIVASIGPNSRVQLGEMQGSWRRIKAHGVAGWVEPRTSFDIGKRP